MRFFQKPLPTTIDQATDIRTCTGNIRKVFDLLLLRYKAGKKPTYRFELVRVGGAEATKRVRELRDGFTTEFLKLRGQMIWSRYDKATGAYYLEILNFSDWAALRGVTLDKIDSQLDLFQRRTGS